MHTRGLLRKSLCYCHGGLLLPSGYKCLQEDALSAVFCAHTLMLSGCVSQGPCSAATGRKILISRLHTPTSVGLGVIDTPHKPLSQPK